ncbi:MAG: tryptophan-rich sensory protein [Acholeplasmataceae bacterium]|nr:tryptophan-rich sensory protein [Acholeplasmataceae bacterium]
MALLALIFATLSYISMIVVNVLANSLPINNINTGDVSYKYPNLFQPAGLTFSIWGIIYTLLFIYIVSQFIQLGKNLNSDIESLYMKINIIFGISSLLNIGWLFAWHYDKMILSTVIMIGLLVSLIFLAKLTKNESLLNQSSFSVYLAWITIATIANITIMLVKLGVPNENNFAVVITSVILIVGVIISYLWISREKDFMYGLVINWAYLGILIRHISQSELNKAYPIIYITTIICLLAISTITLIVYLQNSRNLLL